MTRNKDANVKLLKILLEEYQPTIEELQKKIQKLEDRNDQYVSIHTEKLQKMKSDIKAHLYTILQREINNLEDTVEETSDDEFKSLIIPHTTTMKQLLSHYLQ